MLRGIRLLSVGLVLVATTGQAARSQYNYPYGSGYGGYGFGGWGVSPVGDIARGYGALARGEGVYNYDTAVAASVNEDTVVRYNQYLYNSMLEGRRQYGAYEARKLKLDKGTYDKRKARIRENPNEGDIDSGDALNVILDQLTDPRLMHGSALRMASASISPKAIKDIPFIDETDAVTLCLDGLTDPASWPLSLRSDALKPEREAYQKAIDDALAEDKDGGALKPETITRVRDCVSKLFAKVKETIPVDKQPDHLQAMNYLKGLAGLSRMLEKPNVESILSELEKVESTTAGNLIAFMHAYNLRFGPAVTPKQRAIYRELFPVMDEARDRILPKPGDAPANSDTPPPPPADHATGLFHGMDPTHLNPQPLPPKQ